MEYRREERNVFFEAVKSIIYRDDDVKEAKELGCPDIMACYTRMDHFFARYYVIYDDDGTPISTAGLQRNGNIVFFTSKVLSSHVKLVRTFKRLAHDVAKQSGAIMTKTAIWYDEAQRINKILGFKPHILEDFFGLYVLNLDKE